MHIKISDDNIAKKIGEQLMRHTHELANNNPDQTLNVLCPGGGELPNRDAITQRLMRMYPTVRSFNFFVVDPAQKRKKTLKLNSNLQFPATIHWIGENTDLSTYLKQINREKRFPVVFFENPPVQPTMAALALLVGDRSGLKFFSGIKHLFQQSPLKKITVIATCHYGVEAKQLAACLNSAYKTMPLTTISHIHYFPLVPHSNAFTNVLYAEIQRKENTPSLYMPMINIQVIMSLMSIAFVPLSFLPGGLNHSVDIYLNVLIPSFFLGCGLFQPTMISTGIATCLFTACLINFATYTFESSPNQSHSSVPKNLPYLLILLQAVMSACTKEHLNENDKTNIDKGNQRIEILKKGFSRT